MAIDREFFGVKGDLKGGEITALRKTASAYIEDVFLPELKEKFNEAGFTGIEFKLVDAASSDQDPRIIEIYYPALLSRPLLH